MNNLRKNSKSKKKAQKKNFQNGLTIYPMQSLSQFPPTLLTRKVAIGPKVLKKLWLQDN